MSDGDLATVTRYFATILSVENVFIAVTVTLAAAAVGSFIWIVRDVLPYLSAEHRNALKHHSENSTIQQLRAGDKAIGKAWQTQVAVFPQSRKRLLFAALVVLAALSVMTYPLRMAFGSR